MAALRASVSPWNDGASTGPWTRLAPAAQARNATSPVSPIVNNRPQSTRVSVPQMELTTPISDAFATMRNDSTWSSAMPSVTPSIGRVTSGLGFSDMGNSKFNEYKSKGFSNSLASFLGRYNMDSLAQQQAMQQAEWAAQNQQQGGGNPSSWGVGNPGGEYANVDRWNGEIMAAIQRVKQEFGMDVPPNVVKAVMMLESQGNMVGCNFAGYCGLMQTGAGSNVSNFNAAYNNTVEGNLYYGVQELGNWYRAVGTGNWIDAAAAYFSGYNYDNPGVSDGYGTTVAQYRQIITKHLNAFNNAGGGGAQGGGSGGGPGVMSLFGSGSSIGYDFGVSSRNGLYGYGTSYGLDGTQHTGLDVMQPLGSPLYAPAGGTVVCVGCWRNDHLTGGVGRIEIEMPDGAHVLFDHTNKSYVEVGQRLQGGELIGTSGGMYSPHTHLEVRVPDSSQSSGWRLIDAAAYFAGYVGGGGYSQSGGYTPVNQPMNSYQRALQALYGRWW